MKLITNGDDFGITKAVNYGMIDCFKEGIMTSCSMMANMPAVKHAAELMKENPELSVGIHINLTVGKPLLKTHKTLLKEDGTFNKGMLKESKHVDIEEVRAEAKAQIEYFIEVTGQKPTHINSHHGIEMIQGGEQIICELSKIYDLPVRRFFTLPEGNHQEVDYIIPLMKMKHSGKIDFSKDFTTLDKILDLYTKEEIQSNDIYEFALHPGYMDYDILQFSSLTEGRVHDAYLFLADEVKTWVNENNIELVSYEDIPKK